MVIKLFNYFLTIFLQIDVVTSKILFSIILIIGDFTQKILKNIFIFIILMLCVSQR